MAVALRDGSLLTLGLLGIVGAYMVFNWRDFFTTFHRIFFKGDTWTFPYSDTLIRLFPIRFWRDSFIAVGVITILISVFFIFLGKNQVEQPEE